MNAPKALIIGAGVAGLTAATELADLGIDIILVEKSLFPGGHAAQLACKALDACVHCGACLLEEKLSKTLIHPRIKLFTTAQVTALYPSAKADGNSLYQATIQQDTPYIDAARCDNCGACFDQCPHKGAVLRGTSAHHQPFFAIDKHHCHYFMNNDCRECEPVCPVNAIDLDRHSSSNVFDVGAVIATTGFSPFNPSEKPYGHGGFADVITTLEAERMLREKGSITRPSDGERPKQVAFIQCVGSREKKLNHLWCSKICCGTSLRLARRIKREAPETDLCVFYIDIQTFGKDFGSFLNHAEEEIRFKRIIPADIFETSEGGLQVNYFDTVDGNNGQSMFDLVVLAIGLTPPKDMAALSKLTGLNQTPDGFFEPVENFLERNDGLFACGTATGPASIAETMAQAGTVALAVFKNLKGQIDS
jgi:heterodisulfide reductase subunit A2